MVQFSYKVIQSDGTVAEGTLEAQGRFDALNQIDAKGWKAIQLNELSKPNNHSVGLSYSSFRKKISFRELENFTRLLSNLLASGISLSRALGLLYKETTNPTASEKWKAIHSNVIDGMSLADAMSKHPEVFPSVYIAMVEAGETGGFLDIVLNQIADFQNRERDLKSKVIAALIYPIVLLLLSLVVLIFLLVFFIPRFQSLFQGFGADLPWLTQVIVAASDLIRHYGVLVVLVILVMTYFAHYWLSTDHGKRTKEIILLNLPIIGPLNAKFAMARFCRMLGTLLGAGVPLIQGLHVARRSIHNQILVDTVKDSIERVKKGEQLATSFRDCKQLFSGSVLEMISVAEETSRLDQELVRLAETTEQDLERNLRSAVALSEPLMLFFIAAFIGTIFIGMVIPIFTIQDYIK